MKFKTFLTELILIFCIIFVVSGIVTYIWEGAFNWETMFRFAIILGLAIPLANGLKKKKREK